MLQVWSVLTLAALQRAWDSFLNFIPALLAAIVIFVIGWIVAALIGKLAAEVLKRLQFNKIFEKGNWDEALAKANIKVDASGFIGAIVKWVLVIVVLQIAVGILGERWNDFANILSGVIGYLPNVVVAVLIFVATVIIADIVEKIVRVSVERVRVGYGHVASAIIKWAIWVFAILAILQQLRFEAATWVFELIKIAFIGVVAVFAIAFGLGGRDVAAKMIEEFKQKMSQK